MRTNNHNPLTILTRIYTDPLRPAALVYEGQTEIAPHTRHQRDILRFMAFNVALAQVVRLLVSIPAPPPFEVTLNELATIALGALTLVLISRGRYVLASTLFVYGVLVVIAWAALIGPGNVSFRSLLALATLPPLVVMSGLLLPIRALWPTTGSILLGLMLGLIVFPTDPELQAAIAPQNSKVLIGGIFIFLILGTALMTWYMARNAILDYRTVLHAFHREQELTELKDHFIVNVNHELRTPIMSFYTNVELLQKVHTRVGDEQRGTIIERSLRAGQMVLRMLNTILDFDVVSASTPNMTPSTVVLAPMVHALVETFDPTVVGEPGMEGMMLTQRDVGVAIAPEVRVWADEVRLRQILINLLTNALKYSDPGSPISIMAMQRRDAKGAGTWVEIIVRDHGLGVPSQSIPQLFQRFVRLERDIAGPVRGTGVGLYLCRVLVETMGGRIWVESSGIPGEGSAFHFTLPEPA